MDIFIDIETIPAIHWTPAQKYENAFRQVPATHKKPDTIRAWVIENQEEFFRKTSFDYLAGWIACVCVGTKDGEVTSFYSNTYSNTLEDRLAAERDILEQLESYLECRETIRSKINFIGWNNAGFDMPWLYRAAVRAGCWGLAKAICPPGLGKYKLPWIDLMDMWGCFQFGKGSKQTAVAQYLGIAEPNPELSGSLVYQQWLQASKTPDEKPAYVIHCESDIITLREIARRLGAVL